MQEIYWDLTGLYQLYKTVGSSTEYGDQLKFLISVFLIQSNKHFCPPYQIVKG